MNVLRYLKKEEQQLMPLFNGAFIENKPIPFPDKQGTTAYSNLFYWAHLEANETSEFPLHPHEGFEIMTFVFQGMVEHYDTSTKVWTPLRAGQVQVIQAGSGIQHSERITKGTRLFQIWFDPDFSKTMIKDASYQDYQKDIFVAKDKDGISRLSYVGKYGVIKSETDGLEIQKLILNDGSYEEILDDNFTYSYYLLTGEMYIEDKLLNKDSFIVLKDSNFTKFIVNQLSELFVIKTHTNVNYKRFIQRY